MICYYFFISFHIALKYRILIVLYDMCKETQFWNIIVNSYDAHDKIYQKFEHYSFLCYKKNIQIFFNKKWKSIKNIIIYYCTVIINCTIQYRFPPCHMKCNPPMLSTWFFSHFLIVYDKLWKKRSSANYIYV